VAAGITLPYSIYGTKDYVLTRVFYARFVKSLFFYLLVISFRKEKIKNDFISG
jgi:hypothetical protein